MKKFLAFLLICVLGVPLVLGGVLAYSYSQITTEAVPAVVLGFREEQLQPNSYEWHEPVAGGMFYKDFVYAGSEEATDLGVLSSSTVPFTYPAGYDVQVTLVNEDTLQWSGSGEEWNQYIMMVNGNYRLEVTCAQTTETRNRPYGYFRFLIVFTLDFEPILETSPTTVSQGDVVAIRVSYLQEGVVPTIESNLVTTDFVMMREGEMVAYVGTRYDTLDTEEYYATVQAGSYAWSIPITVVYREHPTQNLTIDTSTPSVAASLTQAAIDAYNAAIPPVLETADSDKYWSGQFLQPVEDRISTEYGTRRYTNGRLTSSFHQGMDIAADGGDPIVAPAAGRVLYADFLDRTGYTIVIEHGGGLKTVYYHMNDIYVQAGDMVAAGDYIADVGTTGYSTGDHLHFEVRVRNVPINPHWVLDGSSNLYYFS